MPSYRIHRLKEHVRQQFRHAPHVPGIAAVKERDYEADATGESCIEAATPYAAYFALRDAGTELQVGDLLETESGELRIFKYVGFEEARWFVPEPKPEGVLVQNVAI